MKPEIKYLHSPDVDELETYNPGDDFCFLLQVVAGPQGEAGEESFDVVVCSPKGLSASLRDGKILIGRHYLIMNAYEYERLVSFLHEECDKCSGQNWEEVASKLGRIGRWEFEDYKPSSAA